MLVVAQNRKGDGDQSAVSWRFGPEPDALRNLNFLPMGGNYLIREQILCGKW